MRTIRQHDIRGFQARYHRNGTCGNGFYACRFLLIDGNEHKPMTAVVFPGQGNVAVMSANIGDRYRGDHFEDVLREAIKFSGRVAARTSILLQRKGLRMTRDKIGQIAHDLHAKIASDVTSAANLHGV